jgi:hypothetical protein
MPDARSAPMSRPELPLSGTVGWHAAWHCVVVNKTRLPQNFRVWLVLQQLSNEKQMINKWLKIFPKVPTGDSFGWHTDCSKEHSIAGCSVQGVFSNDQGDRK